MSDLTNDVLGADFTAAQALTIGGHFISVNGRGLSNEIVVLSGDTSASTQTDADGAFSFSVAAGGTYNIAPSDSRVQSWIPFNSRDFTNLAQAVGNADFEAEELAFTGFANRTMCHLCNEAISEQKPARMFQRGDFALQTGYRLSPLRLSCRILGRDSRV